MKSKTPSSISMDIFQTIAIFILALFIVSCGSDVQVTEGPPFSTVMIVTNPLQGTTPQGSLTTDGGIIFGRAHGGGIYNGGVSFSMLPDGSNYNVIHDFGSAGDSTGPRHDSMMVMGNELYGMTMGDGGSDLGAIFSHTTSGSDYRILHSFQSSATDGSTPHSCPRLNPLDGFLYGLTELGGTSNDGTLFKISTDGNIFNILHSFSSATDGSHTHGSVTFNGTTLYGMNLEGGAHNKGTIFSYNTANDTFTVLHSFTGLSDDGALPIHCNVVVVNNILYGTTTFGGTHNDGTIWSMNLDGTSFSIIYSFTGSSDGSCPEGSLMYDSNTAKFYGMTSGLKGCGSTLFSITTSGTFAALHNFETGLTCEDNVILLNGRLWGMALNSNPAGSWILFSYRLPGN
ncbi:MAG: hypothetical protein NTX36_16285 [Proteobacteria bacterium]|nr:hypothetical protein [Pseudomonadota bacterium]